MEKNKQMKYYLRKSAFGLASVSAAFLLGSTVAADKVELQSEIKVLEDSTKTDAEDLKNQLSSFRSKLNSAIYNNEIDGTKYDEIIEKVEKLEKSSSFNSDISEVETSSSSDKSESLHISEIARKARVALAQAKLDDRTRSVYISQLNNAVSEGDIARVAELEKTLSGLVFNTFSTIRDELANLRLSEEQKEEFHYKLLKAYDRPYDKIGAMNIVLAEAKRAVTNDYFNFVLTRLPRLNLTDDERQDYRNRLVAAYKNADDRFGALNRTFEEAHALSEERNLAKEKATNIEHATAGLVSFLKDEKPAEDTIKEIALDEAKVLADRELSKHGASHYYHVLVNKANTVEGVNQIVKDVVESIKANNIASATEGLVDFLRSETPAEDTVKSIALSEAKVLAHKELDKYGASLYFHNLVDKASTVDGVNQIVKDVVESIKAKNIANATEGLVDFLREQKSPEVMPEVKPEVEPEVKPEVEPEVKPENKPVKKEDKPAEAKKDEKKLPSTGETANPFFTAAAFAVMASAGMVAVSSKRKED
ncbi:albumin-binding GA domain-containing protein [Streptococcus dysgalactiae]|uniref:albumin-binding GA domain-containing protein n=1 Tax=Streptococcus dysgalactiae TaxID=1334 RepID=UPI0024695A96|nr:albumin-binding GA domain-containing protein [Streptococcus dysgalactiae]